jgi:hypothetical protein
MVQVDVDGRKAWLPAESADASMDEAPIPDGYVDRVSRTAGWISPVLVVDGVIRGTWTHERSGGAVAIEVTPFGRVSPAMKKAAAEHAQRYGDLFDAPVDFRCG